MPLDLIKRHRSEVFDSNESQKLYRDDPSGPVLMVQKSHKILKDQNWMTGWDIPGYHKLRREGKILPHTPFRRSRFIGSTEGSYDISSNDFTSHWWSEGRWTPSEAWNVTSTDMAAYAPENYSDIVQEAAAKIYNTGHDTLTCIAELASLQRMFRSTLKRLLRLEFPPYSTRKLASDWLAYRYGWRTLMYDIQDISAAIESLNNYRNRYSEKAGTTTTFTERSTSSLVKAHYTLTTDVESKVTIGVRGSVVADIEVPAFQFNPLSTAWELIPFSFIVDWFYSVGTALSAMSFLSLQTDYQASVGYQINVERKLESYISDFGPTYSGGSEWQTGNCEAMLRDRVPATIPKLPHMTLKLSPFKIFDLLAIFTQRVR